MNIRSTVIATDRYAQQQSSKKPHPETVPSQSVESKDGFKPRSQDVEAFELGAIFGGLMGGGAGALAGPVVGLNLAGVSTRMIQENGYSEYLGPMLKGCVAGAVVGGVGVGLAVGLWLAARSPGYED